MLEQILESAREKIKVINNSRSLQDAKVEYLGKSSQINQEMKKLGKATPEERKTLGQKINKVKQEIQAILDEQGTLQGNLPASSERLEFMRATNTNGKVTPFNEQDSSMLRALALANALLVRPAYAPPARSGETVRFLSL